MLTVGSAFGPSGQELHGVIGAHWFSDGGLVVANGGSHELKFFGIDGALRYSIGRAGDGPGEFRRLALLKSFAGDSLFAYDSRQRRATVLGPGGEVARSFRLPDTIGSIDIVDVFENGHSLARIVAGFRSDETPTGVYRRKIHLLELSREGALLRDLGEFAGAESFALAESGSMVVGPLVFGASLQVAAVGRNRAVVGTSDEQRLHLVGVTADYSFAHGLARRRATEADFRSAVDDYLSDFPAGIRAIEARRFDVMPRVTTLPFFGEILTDPNANVWVQHYSPPGDRTRRWTVFDGLGELVANAGTPTGADVLEIGRVHVVVLATDELGVERVEVVPLRTNCAGATLDRLESPLRSTGALGRVREATVSQPDSTILRRPVAGGGHSSALRITSRFTG